MVSGTERPYSTNLDIRLFTPVAGFGVFNFFGMKSKKQTEINPFNIIELRGMEGIEPGTELIFDHNEVNFRMRYVSCDERTGIVRLELPLGMLKSLQSNLSLCIDPIKFYGDEG